MLKADYVKLARAALKDFEEQGVSLTTSVKTAVADMKLNVEQANRLAEFTNTIAHMRLFDKQAGDKYIDFELVDPASLTAPAGGCACGCGTKCGCVEKVAAVNDEDFFLDLPNMHAPMEKLAADEAEATRQYLAATSPSIDQFGGHRKGQIALRMHKTAEALRLETVGAYGVYIEGVEKLAETLTRTQPSVRQQFVGDVLALYKHAGECVLADLVGFKPRLGLQDIKEASVWPFESALTQQVGAIIADRDQALTKGNSYQYLVDQLGQ